jgi:hypothetical protein
MGKYSAKMMGKEVGPASVYAEPHTMSGEPLKATKMTNPNTLSAKQVSPRTVAMSVSIGDSGADDVKTTGIETRGNGAATKGRMARGPMA